MVSFAKRRPKRVEPKSSTGTMVVFGPPSIGTTMVVECLSGATEASTTVVPYLGPSSIPDILEATPEVDIVFVDVDGGVFSQEDVQALVDNRIVYTSSGAIVRLYAPDDEILHRASERPDYVSKEDLAIWSASMEDLENRIRLHNLSYYMVPVLFLEEAVKQLALRCGLSK